MAWMNDYIPETFINVSSYVRTNRNQPLLWIDLVEYLFQIAMIFWRNYEYGICLC